MIEKHFEFYLSVYPETRGNPFSNFPSTFPWLCIPIGNKLIKWNPSMRH